MFFHQTHGEMLVLSSIFNNMYGFVCAWTDLSEYTYLLCLEVFSYFQYLRCLIIHFLYTLFFLDAAIFMFYINLINNN